MAGRVVPLSTSEQTVAAAAGRSRQPGLARSTRRSYSQTLTRLVRELGGQWVLPATPRQAEDLTVDLERRQKPADLTKSVRGLAGLRGVAVL